MLYAPANLLPILETSSPFGSRRDTILSGVVALWEGGSWPLAVVILIASVLIPLAKLLVLAAAVAVGAPPLARCSPRARAPLPPDRKDRPVVDDRHLRGGDRSTLVQLRGLATIRVGPAAVAFGAVVVLTMLATRAFDPRLIWDSDLSSVRAHA